MTRFYRVRRQTSAGANTFALNYGLAASRRVKSRISASCARLRSQIVAAYPYQIRIFNGAQSPRAIESTSEHPSLASVSSGFVAFCVNGSQLSLFDKVHLVHSVSISGSAPRVWPLARNEISLSVGDACHNGSVQLYDNQLHLLGTVSLGAAQATALASDDRGNLYVSKAGCEYEPEGIDVFDSRRMHLRQFKA